jgi:tetratricopeptide (TPR) repeat protein
LLRELSAREQPERLHALYLLGNALRKTGHDDEGLACYREVDELLRQTGVQPAIFLSNLRALADCALQSKDGTETALRFLGEAESFAAGRDDLLDEDVVDARMGLARLHWTLGNLDTCERITRAVMASPRFRANSASTLECRNTLGVCLRDQRRWAEAEPILRSVLEERTNKFGPTSPPTANSMINLALTLIQVGRCDEALKLADGAKAIRADLGPSDSPEILECDAVRGACLVAQGRKSEGLSLFDALLHRRGQTASGNWFTDALAVPYVWSLAKAGDTNRAEAFLTQELETARAALGPKHFITIRRQIRLTRFRDHTSPGWTEPSKAL